jgi:hypothetical protein
LHPTPFLNRKTPCNTTPASPTAIMSMEQIDRYLRACPRATQFPDFQEQYIFHFIYDYYLSPDEFIGRFPSARPVGVAWLPEWAWHINEKGV